MRKRNILTIILVISCLLFSGCGSNLQQNENVSAEESDINLEVSEDTTSEEDIPQEEETQEEEFSQTEEETQTDEIIQTEEETQEEEIVQTEVSVPIEEDDFVRVNEYIPDIEIELKYASTDNFTGQKIYDFTEAYLRYGTVKKLMQVQAELKEKGLSLKIWDAFRPTFAQFTLWNIYPDPTYVANPNNGFSSHSRGNTIDLTIVDLNGNELLMPTKFDDFSELADRDYSDCSEEAREHALLLEDLMKANGFKAYSGEWWHFTDVDTYPVEEEFQP